VSFLLFVDESGHDRQESPYAVLAGVAVEDSRVWAVISALRAAEEEFFGQRITKGTLELKAKTKVFKHAQQMPALAAAERREQAAACLCEGARASKRRTTRPADQDPANSSGAGQASIRWQGAGIVRARASEGVR
jgi:hypothetical protein